MATLAQTTQENSAPFLLMRRKPDPIFVADPDSSFLEAIWSDSQAKQVPPIVAQTAKEAQQILAQFKQHFSGIFINPALTESHGVAIIKSAHHFQPGVPIFFLSDQSEEEDMKTFPMEELKQLGIQRIVRKPVNFSEILKLVTPSAMIFNPNDALEISKQNEDPVEKEIEAKDTSFFATRVENFITGSRSFFDLYIQLSSGRYVKILKAGDSFSADRIISYMKKGVTHFYMRREAQEQYLNYCDKLVAAILKSPKISTDIKIVQTFHHGEKTIDFLKSNGLNPASIEYATGFVSNVEQLVKHLQIDKNKAVQPYLNDIASYDHGVGVSIIASLIARALDMENERAVQTVGLTSLLHDIGLNSLPVNMKKEDEEQMTEAEKRTYRTHPVTGARVLERISGIDPIIPQAVEQHHERRNRSGFPKQLGSTGILQIAEIIGISDELFRLIQKKQQDPLIEPYLAMLNVFDGFSVPVVQAFRSVFIKDETNQS